MISVYVYVLDTMADWEAGYAVAELHSGRFFRKDAPRVSLKTVGCSGAPVATMGGMHIVPDCEISDVAADSQTVLILPGADAWGDARHGAIIEKAREILAAGGTVCAICGATVALAAAGLLDERPHTSNGPGFLEMVVPGYTGSRYYLDEPSVADCSTAGSSAMGSSGSSESAAGTLITAGSTSALPWARHIIAHLDVFRPDTLDAWYAYFSTGNSGHFFALMQTMQS